MGNLTAMPIAGEVVARKPAGMVEIGAEMSNFDGVIDDGFADDLRAQPGRIFGRHSAWDFNGKVWFADGRFHEEVWCYGSPREIISADSLEELMKLANDKYGWR